MDVWVDPGALAELRALPGHMRQRIRRVVDDLVQEPRPPRSQALELPPDAAEICPSGVEVRRLSLASWRVVYAVDDEWQAVTCWPRSAGAAHRTNTTTWPNSWAG